MADRYWVGGSGSWNSTTKWSTTSGGASGASVPTAADNAIFDTNSGTAHFTVTVTDNATCANLTITPEPIVGVTEFAVGNGFVVAGTFSTSGTAGNRRVWFRSSTYGLMRDMRIAAIGAVSDVDFRDIRVTGAGGTLSGTRIGDLRGNSGITFSTPKTVYWNLPAGNIWDQNAWASTSGGSVSTDNFPLAQDIAVIENTGLNTGSTLSLSLAIPYIGSIDMSSRTLSFTLTIFASSVYGDWKNGSGVTLSGTSIVTFLGRKTQTITSSGKTISFPVTVDSYGGTVELADALNIGSQTITVTNGTFDTKGYAVTAGQLSSNNTNIRTINLGSSTVTLSSNTIVSLFGAPNLLTFNAGTSQINSSVSAAVNLQSGGNTFYNVSLNLMSAGTHNISGENTFNNLSITAPSSADQRQVSFAGNQTITGTLTVAGASPVRRIFLRSSTLGIQRELTVGTLVATDCDFRDITIAGAAAGSTPTRAGDCGNNSGITFPAPKTVYWNLPSGGNWSSNAWASTAAGTVSITNFPLAQDTAVFDDSFAAGGTISINNNWNIGNVDMSGRTSAMTFSLTSSLSDINVYGNWAFGTGVTSASVPSSRINFIGINNQTITSNGVSFNCIVAFGGGSGRSNIISLGDAFSNLATLAGQSILLNGGATFNAVNYNVTGWAFRAISGGTLMMGSGTWTLTGNGTGSAAVWYVSSTGLAFYKNSANIVFTSPSTNAREFAGGDLSYNKFTISGSVNSTTTITGNNQFAELASTKTVAHTIDLGTTTQRFGAWTVSGTAGNVVTVTGTGTSHLILGSRVSGVNYLTMGSIGFSVNSPAEFYAGPNSSGSSSSIIKTAAPTPVTRYWVGGTGTWNSTNIINWSASSGGAGGASVPTSADNVVFDSLSNATSYTVTCSGTQLRCASLTMAGPASGNVTWSSNTPLAIHGSISLAATGVTRNYEGEITLSGSTPGKTITTNGIALDSNITVSGVGGEWTLGSALNIGTTKSLYIGNGIIDFNTYNFTGVSIVANSSTSRTIAFGSGTTTLSGTTPIDFGTIETNAAGLTITAGTSQINCSIASPIFTGNNKAFYNVAFTSPSLGTVTLNGINTFNNLSFAGVTSGAGLKNISLTANQTINGTLILSAGTNATMRQFVRSDTIGTTRTLTCAAVSATDVDFRDIAIVGAAAPASGTRLGDCKGNSGITFPAAKTVYWNQSGSNNWSITGWATSDGGTTAVNNFPLAQDTAVFTAISIATGATITINASYNIGTIDMSARTTKTMTLATGSTTPTIYGNWINGTGTTITGSGTLTFAGRGSQTITSAGRSFPGITLTVATIGGSVTLQDALTLNSTLNITHGTFTANGYNISISGGVSTNATTLRTINIGGATWTFTSDWAANTSTNLTVTGTGTLNMTGASAKTFNGGGISYSGITLNQGGAGALTITGNNTFGSITNTYKATGATTIALGTTTQRVGAFGASGEAGRVLTVTGTSATSPATLVFTGSGQATTPTTDYLTITGVRAYSLDTTWYAGNNSTNNGSLGWLFAAATSAIVSAAGKFFLFFN